MHRRHSAPVPAPSTTGGPITPSDHAVASTGALARPRTRTAESGRSPPNALARRSGPGQRHLGPRRAGRRYGASGERSTPRGAGVARPARWPPSAARAPPLTAPSTDRARRRVGLPDSRHRRRSARPGEASNPVPLPDDVAQRHPGVELAQHPERPHRHPVHQQVLRRQVQPPADVEAASCAGRRPARPGSAASGG